MKLRIKEKGAFGQKQNKIVCRIAKQHEVFQEDARCAVVIRNSLMVEKQDKEIQEIMKYSPFQSLPLSVLGGRQLR